MSTKYIFVTGGVVSGLGKGITAASLGKLLKSRRMKVTIQKFDPYINVDPGTMSPYQHGEVFVTDDGAETDLDLGHYERFIDENLSQNSNITSGKIYKTVIEKERAGDFGGGTVQVIPHITNEIKSRIFRAANTADVVITEIGGTVGDIESLPFLEAIRQVSNDVGRDNCMYVHVTLVPYISCSKELKTKPTQHSVKELLSLGIQPDVIVCRAEVPIPQELRDKIALFCNVKSDCVIQNIDSDTLYEIPLLLEKEGLPHVVCRRLSLECPKPDMDEWVEMVKTVRSLKANGGVNIALVGKYTELQDAYLSVVEALKHGGIHNKINVNINWVCSESLNEETINEALKGQDGIIVPGGFGDRGTEGKILAAKYARENKIPYFGICLGMQIATIEFARNVLGLEDANSTEFTPDCKYPVIHIMPEKENLKDLGGTLRLGLYPCALLEDSLIRKIYNCDLVNERHRHRYEVNNKHKDQFAQAGLIISGTSPDNKYVEIIELKSHPWFIGVQFHPEFKSRPNRAHPLFASFIEAAKTYAKKKTEDN